MESSKLRDLSDSGISIISKPRRKRNPYRELQGSFTAKKWRRVARSSLLSATSAVDELSRTIVLAKSHFESCQIGPEIRRLALTIAVFERSLYAYALRIQRRQSKTELEIGPLDAVGGGPPSPQERDKIPPSLLPIIPPMNTDSAAMKSKSSFPKFFPRSDDSNLNDPDLNWNPTGGIVVLLNLLSDTLRRTKHVLSALNVENPNFIRFVLQRKVWLLLLLPPSLYFRTTLSKYLSQLAQFLLIQINLAFRFRTTLSLPSLKIPIPFPEGTRTYDLSSSSSLILLPLFFFLYYQRVLTRRHQKLIELHQRLGVLLRLWHICTAIVEQEDRPQNEPSKNKIPISSQWLLERVPPTLDSAFWYQHNWQLSTLKYGLDVLYCSVNSWYRIFGKSKAGIPHALLAALYYALRPKRAAARCSEILGSPNLEMVQMAWATIDLPPLRWICAASVLEKPQFRNRLLVEKEYLLLKEPPHVPGHGGASLDEKQPSKGVKVLLLSAHPIDLAVDLRLSVPAKSHSRKPQSNTTVILYFHGGGWISEFRASHLHFVTAWARQTDAVILYVDFSLAPNNAYPAASNECYDVYKWVIRGGLGFKPIRCVLAGDSTGGNLAVGTCIKALQEGSTGAEAKRPDAIVLAYPILNLKLAPTPSRSLFMMDPILPMNLLLQCRSLYVPPTADTNTDPCLSPVVTEDRILANFPPTSIMVGGYDPFLDDSIDFAHRLNANGVVCRLKVYPHLPHCFLNFTPILSTARRAVDQAAQWLKAP